MTKIEEEKEIKRILQYNQETFDGKVKSIVALMEAEKWRVADAAVTWAAEYSLNNRVGEQYFYSVNLKRDMNAYLNEILHS